MNKLVLVSFLVIFIGGCHGFPNGVEVRDQHFQGEMESRIHVENDQHLEKGKAVIERESRGNAEKKILRMLVKELKSVRENQDNMASAISNQDSKLDNQDSKLDAMRENQDNITSAISNQDSKLDAMRENQDNMTSAISNQDSKLDAMSSDISNQGSRLNTLNSAVSNQDSKLNTLNSAVSNQGSKLNTLNSAISNQDSKLNTLNSAVSNQGSKLNTLNSAISNQDSKLNSMSSAISDISAKLDIAACAGGFSISGTCFKVFTDQTRSWAASRSKCQQEGLDIAQPADGAARQLRKHIMDNYADRGYWVGGKGDGSYIRWARGGGAIPSSNPLWRANHPSSVTSTTCMLVEAVQSVWQKEPNKPYMIAGCSYTLYTVCEVV